MIGSWEIGRLVWEIGRFREIGIARLGDWKVGIGGDWKVGIGISNFRIGWSADCWLIWNDWPLFWMIGIRKIGRMVVI